MSRHPHHQPTVIYSQYNRYDVSDDGYHNRRHHHGRHYGHSDQSWKQPVVIRRRLSSRTSTGALSAGKVLLIAREYTNRVTVGGRVQESYGTACCTTRRQLAVAD